MSSSRRQSGQNPFFDNLMAPPSGFYRVQSANLARIVTKLNVPPHRVEDVIQEVWLDAVKHRDHFRTQQELCSWLNKTLYSKVMDLFRRLCRQRAKSLEALPAEPMDRNAANRAAQKEEFQWLASVLEEAGAQHSKGVWLLREHYLVGRKLQDLANQTGSTVNAVRNRIARTLNDLRCRVGYPSHDAEAMT